MKDKHVCVEHCVPVIVEAMMRIMAENIEENKIKAAAKEKQAALEIEGMREYNKILDQQEAARPLGEGVL